jgi:hypothetical protein
MEESQERQMRDVAGALAQVGGLVDDLEDYRAGVGCVKGVGNHR